jgi:hypothetical protein
MTTIGVPDLTLRYEWHEGSVPPPFHYEYTIALEAGGAGTVDFFPDYPQHGVTPWRRAFQASPANVAALLALMDKKRVFERRWHRARRHTVGGSHAYLDATVGGRAVSVPAGLPPRDARSIAPVYDAIRALVPKAIWDKLFRRYEEYQFRHARQ